MAARARGMAPALALALLTCLGADLTAAEADSPPAIGLIIDDVGYRLHDGLRALALPGPLAYSVLPHSPNGAELAAAARRLGKDVLLHLPMHAQENNHLLGPGALMEGMSQGEFLATLDADLAFVPGAIGLNNHMGSLLTRRQQPMRWLMEALMARGGDLIFIDSRTSGATVAGATASAAGVPLLNRDVFLDNETDPAYIRGQFEHLTAKARETGAALGIAHPRPETIAVLAEVLPQLQRAGIRLVALPELFAIQQRRNPTWQPSLSHSPRVVKN